MPNIVFNTKTLTNLKPKTKPVEYYEKGRDHGAGAFGLRVSPRGKCVWFIRYKISGTTKRYTLGTYPDLGLKDARLKAYDIMVRVSEGEDPLKDDRMKEQLQEQLGQAAPTMTDLWGVYEAKMDARARPKKPSTRKEENRKWESHIKPVMGEMPVAKVTTVLISDMLDSHAKKAPVAANRLYTFMQRIFPCALEKQWIVTDPMVLIKDPPGGKEQSRSIVLTAPKIKKLWPYFDGIKSNPRDCLRLLLLTAQRPGEVMSMEWRHIDFEERLWVRYDTKNETATFLVPLSPQVITLLKARKGEAKLRNVRSKWVFPSAYNKAKGAVSGHMMSTKDARRKLREASGLKGWTAHDLRRSARTLMSKLRIERHIRERVLNHKIGGVEGVYDQWDYVDEKREALDLLSNEIFQIIEG